MRTQTDGFRQGCFQSSDSLTFRISIETNCSRLFLAWVTSPPCPMRILLLSSRTIRPLPHCRKRLKSPGFSDRNHHVRHFSHDARPAPNTLRGRPTSHENRPATNSRRARRFAYCCRPDSNNRRDCHSLYDSRPSASTRRDCPTSCDCRLSSKSRRAHRNGCVLKPRRYRPGQPPTLLPKIVSRRSP